jgi:hypothetical protein
MRINLSEEIDKRTDLSWFVIEALCAPEKATHKRFTDVVPAEPHPVMVDVEFRINGTEVDLRHHVDRMASGFDRCVREKAVEMVTEVMGADFNDRIDKLRNLFDAYEREVREKFGLPAEDD